MALTTPKGITKVIEVRVETPAQAVEFYRRWLNGAAFLIGGHKLAPRPPTLAQIRAELAWRDLACWCPLAQPCHADVLLELANNRQIKVS
ncbi:DUF4326 domain-containing protein [Mycobacterium sp. E1747]|uniref:DUF4326 domain-containing protein n=1 Tax=Mycobacterium sp. E1747 TaxID=1834128 RepID=UPI003514DB50